MSGQTTWERRPEKFSDVDAATWNDWHWQQQNRLRSPADFRGVLELTSAEKDAWKAAAGLFRVAVTPHYAALMHPSASDCPIRRQALPHAGELLEFDFELEDPLAEESHMPVPGLTHRYPDRVLLYATHNCPVYCRHCTRKRKVADPSSAAQRAQLSAGIDYIRRTETVRDVVISGGDPLSLADHRLEEILAELRPIPHLDVIRIGTRNPVTLPQRITPELGKMLAKYRPLYINTHFNHPHELGPDAARALRILLDAGCVLGNQMVLLRGVNDSPETVMSLNRGLLREGCRPYYILQCDMARGITHFRTPLEVGLEIMRHLRGRLGGVGIPDFVVDLPDGGGKVELVPDTIVSRNGNEITFESAAGRRVFHDYVD